MIIKFTSSYPTREFSNCITLYPGLLCVCFSFQFMIMMSPVSHWWQNVTASHWMSWTGQLQVTLKMSTNLTYLCDLLRVTLVTQSTTTVDVAPVWEDLIWSIQDDTLQNSVSEMLSKMQILHYRIMTWPFCILNLSEKHVMIGCVTLLSRLVLSLSLCIHVWPLSISVETRRGVNVSKYGQNKSHLPPMINGQHYLHKSQHNHQL